jgi:hypothetical protein
MASLESRLNSKILRQEVCHVPGCRSPSQRSSQVGLSELYCKRHIEFHRRHGSFWHRSISAADLSPYRAAAKLWLKLKKDDARLYSVSTALDSLLGGSGVAVSAYDIRRLSAHRKAQIALARLREAHVTGGSILEVTLAVMARVANRGPDNHEFLEVNIAKALHRKASGTHRTTSGLPMPSKYPASAGRVLRVLGHQVWDIVAIVADSAAIAEIIKIAQPAVAVLDLVQARRRQAEEAVASEILRVSSFGMGPERLALYEDQLRRQHGLKRPR